METNIHLFDDTSLADIMRDIYQNSKKKDMQIKKLIKDLQPLIKNIGDATVIVPLIKEYLDVSVKNDEQLVKLAAIVQRLASATVKATGGTDSLSLSPEEREQLLKAAEQELDKLQVTNDD